MAKIVKTGKVGSNIPKTTQATGGIQAWRYPLGRPVLTPPAARPGPTTYRPAPSNQPAPAPAKPKPDPTLPFSGALQARNLAIDTDLNTLLGQLGANRDRAAIQYGFRLSGDTNGDGIPDGPAGMDVSDPASRAALLQRHWQDAKRGTETRMGARGQAFSGAFQRAQQRNNENESIQFTQLGREFQDVLGQLAAQELGAKTTAGKAKADALWEYTQAVAQNAALYER